MKEELSVGTRMSKLRGSTNKNTFSQELQIQCVFCL